ncbi:MAG: hypothetical protein AAF846_08660 [Chloroflexota bacterium]
MVITVEWYDDDETILIEKFPHKWDAKNYYNLIDEAARLLSTKEYDVDIIGDFGDSGPPSGNILAGLRYAEEKLPPNQGYVILVHTHKLIEVFISIVKQMRFKATENVYTVDSVDEAVAMLEDLKSKEQR